MIYLLLSILCSAAIFIIFKLFEKYQVNTFTAIVVNYCIAGITGFASLGTLPSVEKVTAAPWLLNSFILGIVFITLFNVMAVTAQKLGPSVASIANKMALIVPVIFAIFYYNDSVNALKVAGVALALVGVYLSTHKEKIDGKKFDKKLLVIPLILFLGSGFIDTFLKYNQNAYLNKSDLDARLFPAITFLTAFVIGIASMLFDKSKRDFSRNTLIGGVVLGVVNYGSIYFLIQVFNNSSLESSVVFPINNMGVVLTTAIVSVILFKERFSTKNKIGVLVSIVALLLITLST